MLPSKSFTPNDIVVIARKRVPLLIPPILVGLFVALLLSSKLPDIYEAETLIQIVPQRVPDEYVVSTVTIRTEDRIEAIRQQVESRTQLERMITELNLYPEVRATRPMQDVVEVMKGSTGLDLIRANRIAPVDAFRLKFKYTDPVLAARVTERLAALYVKYNAQERISLSEGANKFLEAQLASAQSRLEEQDAKLRAFRERNAGRLPTQLDYNMQSIQSTQMQRQAMTESLARDRDRKLYLERVYNDTLATPVMTPPTPVQPAQAEAAQAALPLQQQLDMAKSTVARLAQRLKDDHPDMRRARRQVAELEKQVAALPPSTASAPAAAPAGLGPEALQRADRVSTLRAEMESLERQIKFKEAELDRLTGVIRDYQTRIEAVPGVESEFMALTRDYDTLQTQFKNLLAKSESAKVAANLEERQIGEQFRTLDAPRVPGRPISPNRPLMSVAGIGIGALLGLLVVGALELKDGSFKTETEIERVLSLPVVATVPSVITDADRARAARVRMALSLAGGVVLCVGGYVFWAMKLWKYVA